VRRLAGAPELLDGPLDEQVLAGNLRDLARVNRWLGGTRLSIRAIVPLIAGRTRTTLLDVGTGVADIPLRMARFRQLEIHATDVRPEIVNAARRNVGGRPVPIRLATLEDEANDSYDIVHASLVLHHLGPDQAESFLADARRVARVAVVINDLQRGRLWLALARIITRLFTSNAYTRHDAPLSVRRAYTAHEVALMATNAGLQLAAQYRALPPYRYALVLVPTDAVD
jgi:2-polyprenyl-3-methyl-5-hydroxy-6-metoxy-1,4-benzoquinol methylase